MHYVYLLKSKTNDKWYTGSTDNLRKRLKEHNDGKSAWTRKGIPWMLIYYEASYDKNDTRSRELYLKSGMGKRYLKNRLRRFLSLTG
ncbi:MAG: GIY-YIG nuclease family protein [Candidatus Pacebacteria bacterium]|nr:GIY-YIG nuclease family protein [Candidatus Paceibacterota bacterium]